MIPVGKVLWQPTQEWVENSNLYKFRQWLKATNGLEFETHAELYQWSLDHLEDFWQAIWDYFKVEAYVPPKQVLGRKAMPGAEWFPGATLNYAYHIMRNEKPDTTALFFASEQLPLQELSWTKLASDVRRLATRLRELGVEPGDRVACFLPNIPEAAIVLLASSSIGAICATCAPEFGTHSVLDRLKQIEPRVLFCADGYYYKGKKFDNTEKLLEIIDSLPSIEKVVLLPYVNEADSGLSIQNEESWQSFLSGPDVSAEEFEFEPVAFDHPLWVLFSSGTTGIPKAIVHSHGGIILEQFKLSALHYNLKPDDRFFFYTTTGWMMWNYVVSSMMVEARPLLYDGSPTWPEADTLWDLVEQAGIKLFGASPTLQQLQDKAGVIPKNKYGLDKLESIMLAGSPVSAECTNWFYENVKADLYVAPGSGGTEICSGFCGPMPGMDVKAGVIQMPHLGVNLQVFDDDGNSIKNTVGEFVVTQPMPSMPVYLWNDENHDRYEETYFSTYPGVWRHGDYLKIDDDLSCYVLGRSDATLNRYGVRFGTAEVYRSVDGIEAIEDSIIVNLDLPGDKFFMPLFVKLSDDLSLTDDLKQAICKKLREDCSPRHVPDQIYQVDEIPYTLTGKKMEVPVRKILIGLPVEKVANKDAMSNPAALDYFVAFRNTQEAYSLD